MSPEFHAYHEWLNLDRANTAPHFYDLLGLDCFDGDYERIASAAERASSRVRNHRPGPHTARWADLLDEIERAKQTLLDASRKRAYDSQLRQQLEQSPKGENADGTHEVQTTVHRAPLNPDLYPPGFLPHGDVADPMAPVTNACQITHQAVLAAAAAGLSAAPAARGIEASADPLSSADPMAPVPLARIVAPAPAAATIPRGIPLAAPTASDHDVASPSQSPGSHPAPSPTAKPTLPHAPHRSNHAASTHRIELRKKSSAGPLITAIAAIVMMATCLGAVYLALRAGRNRDAANENSTDAARKIASAPNRNDPGSAAAGNGKQAATPASGSGRRPAATRGSNARSAAPQRSAASSDSAPNAADTSEAQSHDAPHPETRSPQPPTPDSTVDIPVPLAVPQPENRPSTAPPPPSKPDAARPVPSEQELLQLSTTLRKARGLVGDGFAKRAKALLDSVASLPMYPAHAEKYDRLARLAEHCANFETLLDKALTVFRGGSELKIGNSFVSVVEITADNVIIRAAGMNRRYSRQEMPLKLSIVFLETGLVEDDVVRMAKALRVLSLADAPENLRSEARNWLERVSPALADEAKELAAAVYEDYDMKLEPPPAESPAS
ncbi:MAG: hypothetical protein FJ295_02950 [Planctomycetes bacterium]|nr:hypothetical protein [Planctomycetota bacterium]